MNMKKHQTCRRRGEIVKCTKRQPLIKALECLDNLYLKNSNKKQKNIFLRLSQIKVIHNCINAGIS